MFTLARFVFRSKYNHLLFLFIPSVFKLRDAARNLLEKELDHLHKNNDAWHIFISKWSNLFNQSYNKEADGALYDIYIRDIFLDDVICKKRFFRFLFFIHSYIQIITNRQQQLMNNIKLNNYFQLFLLVLSVHDMAKKLNKQNNRILQLKDLLLKVQK
jgi:hypothetical protein